MDAHRTSLLLLLICALALMAAGCGGDGTTSSRDDDTRSSTSSSSDSSEGADCWVELFDADDFDASDDHFKLTKPGRYETLKDLPGASQDWTDEADSMKVGSDATVKIWEKTHFEGSSQTLDPGSSDPDLEHGPSSLELTC